MDDHNVIYEGDVLPGEIMIWPVQLFHSTTGDEFSFAYMQHFHVSTALEKYRELTGGKTFELKTKTQEGTGFDMPINMSYKKVLAHFGNLASFGLRWKESAREGWEKD